MARDLEIPDSQEEDPGSISSISQPQTPTEDPQNCDLARQDSLGDACAEDEDETSSCHSSDTTVIITARACPQQRRYTLRQEGFNINGRLAIEAPRYRDMVGMEEQLTQQSTQPFLDPRRFGRTGSMSYQDQSDVICIFHPNSKSACEIVDIVAEVCPQHILHNHGLSPNLDDDDDMRYDGVDDDLLTHEPSSVANGSSAHDIALRLTSKVKDITMGFIFGRNPEKCDIVLDLKSEPKSISNLHFRVYLNSEGIIMLEDASTNGTRVDGELLCKGHTGQRQRHILTQGTVIEVVTNLGRPPVKFVVNIPARDDARCDWPRKVREYIIYRDRLDCMERARARQLTDGVDPLPRPGAQDPTTPAFNLSAAQGQSMLAAGSDRYNYGMRWNGGESYNVIDKIGQGAFATVYKLATKREGRAYACKELEKRRFVKDGVLDMKFNNELEIMKKLDHPHIVKLHEYVEKQLHLYIIMEYVPFGDLSKYLSTYGCLSEDQGISLTRQMSHALIYLHRIGITHRDIKPDNILVVNQNPLTVKLSDFGLSKIVSDGTLLQTFCGTLLYCAPEVYPDYHRYGRGYSLRRPRHPEIPPLALPYSSAVDIWSLSAVMFHAISEKPPYKGSSDNRGPEILEAIMMTELNVSPLKQKHVSKECVTYFKETLHRDPQQRPSALECLDHVWLKGASDIFPDEEVAEEQQLDASQLSLQDPNELQASLEEVKADEEVLKVDGGVLEVDELSSLRQSKRAKVRPDQDATQLSITESFLPNTSNGIVMPFGQPQTGRLFGEIDPSGLPDAGVLDYEAQGSISHVRGVEGSYDRASEIINTHHTNDQLLPNKLQYPSALRSPYIHRPISSAPSLLGAEAQIDQMNMTSPESALSDPTTPKTPNTPKSRQISPNGSSTTRSKRSSQALQPTDNEATPKRPRKVHENSLLSHDTNQSDAVKDSEKPKTKPKATTYDMPGPASMSANGKRSSSSTVIDSSKARDAKNLKGATVTEDVVQDACNGEEKSMKKRKHSETVGDGSEVIVSSKTESVAGQPATTHRSFQILDPAIAPISAITSSTSKVAPQATATAAATQNATPSIAITNDIASSQPTASQSSEGFVKPASRFGKLVPFPGSVLNTTINLTERITSFGRHPDSHYVYPDPLDIRIPKAAMDIVFWRSGIEAAVEAGADWKIMDGLKVIIVTRCSQWIFVNDVKLTKEEPDGWIYGFLRQGDIVTIFEDHTGFLKYRCEFYVGAAKEERGPGEDFKVLKETETFLRAKAEEAAAASLLASAAGSSAV